MLSLPLQPALQGSIGKPLFSFFSLNKERKTGFLTDSLCDCYINYNHLINVMHSVSDKRAVSLRRFLNLSRTNQRLDFEVRARWGSRNRLLLRDIIARRHTSGIFRVV